MTTSEPPRESYAERNLRLSTENQRVAALEEVLAALEAGPREPEPELESLRLLLVDALLDADDYALRYVVDALHRLHAVWGSRDAASGDAEDRGEVRGLHNVASMALERMVPTAVLAELAPESLMYRMLERVAEEPGCSNDDLMYAFDTDKTQVSRAGRRLTEAGLVRKRRLGRRNAWEPTPRGLLALGGVERSPSRPLPRRRQVA
ncbi:MAG TPA: hypothetical protein VF529_21160 [Solirubrobacteraceae bacterium]|jgi:DNA-binding transcriptional ArsR family regulator